VAVILIILVNIASNKYYLAHNAGMVLQEQFLYSIANISNLVVGEQGVHPSKQHAFHL
jgi:hypothetical protein